MCFCTTVFVWLANFTGHFVVRQISSWMCGIMVFTTQCVCIAWPILLQDVCLSVRPSHANILSTPLNISSKFVYHYVFTYQTLGQYSDRDPQRGCRMQGGLKKLRFLTNISLYLQNDASYSRSYYGRRM